MDGRVERRGEESKDRGEKEEIRGKARGLKASLEEQEEEQLETNARREGEVRQSAGQHQRVFESQRKLETHVSYEIYMFAEQSKQKNIKHLVLLTVHMKL